MIDLITAKEYFEEFAAKHSYIQHSATTRSRNRFVTYDMDESNTGDGGELAFPRLMLITDSRFGGYTGRVEKKGAQPLKERLQFEVKVVNKVPNGDYRRHDEVFNETKKVILDLITYMFEEQRTNPCHPLLKYVDFNTIQFYKTNLQTHGDAKGWAVRFELAAIIDGEFEGSLPLPMPGLATPVGTVFYWDGVKIAKLAPGEEGQVLRTRGIGFAPFWDDEDDGGIVNETDPVFTAWLATNPIPVIPTNVSAFTNDAGYLTSLPSHNHDDRYYTESEVDTLLSGKADSSHTHTPTQVGLGNVPNVDATNPANISQSASYRFVSDTEKSTWNNKMPTAVSADAGNVAKLGTDNLLYVGANDAQRLFDPITRLNLFTHLTEIQQGIGAGTTGAGTFEMGNGIALNRVSSSNSATVLAAEPGRHGILRNSSGTTASLTQLIARNVWLSSNSMCFKTFARIQTLADVAQNFYITAGLYMNLALSGAADDAIRFYYNYAVNGGRWLCECTTGITNTTAVDSGVTVNVDTAYDLRIDKSAAGVCTFYINGVLVATISTNVPNNMSMVAAIAFQKTNGSSARTCDFDYLLYQDNV